MSFPEMHVQARDDQIVVMVLLVDEAGGQLARMVIVDQRHDRDLLAVRLFGLGADQAVANQVANRFAACRIALFADVLVERLEQGRLEGNADASQFRHMGTRSELSPPSLSAK